MQKEVFEARHAFEHERRQQLAEAHTLPVAVLTGLLAAVGAMVKTYSWSSGPLSFVFLAFLICCGASTSAAIVFLALSFKGHAYKFLPRPTVVKAYLDDLRGFHADAVEPVEERVAQEFEDFLIRKTVDAADHNFVVNNLRSERLVAANKCVLALLVFTVLAAVMFSVDAASGVTATRAQTNNTVAR